MLDDHYSSRASGNGGSVHEIHEVEPHEHHSGAASHAAKDVRNALLTQLWAVGSLQVVTKKLLGLDNQTETWDLDKAKKMVTTVLAVIAGTSAVADNVAAMLFGINVLETIGQKTVGQEAYDANPHLGESLRRWAFLDSVAAGALSKIGNGANMSVQKIKAIYHDDENDILKVFHRSNSLGESFINPSAWAIVATTIAIGSAQIYHDMELVKSASA